MPSDAPGAWDKARFPQGGGYSSGFRTRGVYLAEEGL